MLSTFTVINTNDSGAGSFRQAILDANASHGFDTIKFGIHPPLTAVTIQPLSPLPTITDSVMIDGFSQPGASVNKLPNSDNAQQLVILDGSLAGANAVGLTTFADNVLIQGLTIQRFKDGISISSPGDTGSVIQGNLIQGNTDTGILVNDDNNIIGGTSPEQYNVIQGNAGQGVWLNNRTAEGSRVQGNFIQDNGQAGVLITGSNNTVGGLTTVPDQQPPGAPTNLIIRNLVGVRIVGHGATGNEVQGNDIGVADDGLGNSIPEGNIQEGVRIENAPGNTIGRATGGLINVISANGLGVAILGIGSTGNRVQGNFIGTDIKGERTIDVGGNFLGNTTDGVFVGSNDGVSPPVAGYACDNLIGGTVSGARNIISGNRQYGVWIDGNGAPPNQNAVGNLVQGNFVGLDVQGILDLGNTFDGVRIENAPGNTVSGTPSVRSIISGNDKGISIIGPAASNNIVQGNLIGLTGDGLNDLGNAIDGVRILNAPDNLIGGTSADLRNFISGNDYGLRIEGTGSVGNLVQGNAIGTDVNGLDNSLGNEINGVIITAGASSNTIGGQAAGAGNTIAFNTLGGVRIESGTGDQVVSNLIFRNGSLTYANGSLGIDLVGPADPPNGVTPNHPGGPIPGPNNFQNHLVLTSVTSNIATSTTIQGTFNSAPSSNYLIQFFSNSILDPSGSGEGEVLIGSTLVTTNAAGNAAINVVLPGATPTGRFITATATSQSGDTSEFSAGIPVLSLPGQIEFSTSAFLARETDTSATIAVTRTGGSSGTATVHYATDGGTAVPGIHFQPVAGTLTFGDGETIKTFTIPLIPGTSFQPDLLLNLVLSSTTGGASLGVPSTATLTITNSVAPRQGAFEFLTPSYTVTGGIGQATFNVVRVGGSDQTVTVGVRTSNRTAIAGVDYGAVNQILTFANGVTSQTFHVPIFDPRAIQGNRAFLMSLFNPTGGASLASPSTATVTIRDVLPPTVQNERLLFNSNGVTGIVLTFSEPLDPARAVNLLNYNYGVQLAGKSGQFGVPNVVVVGFKSAVYDPIAQTVTLTLAHSIHRNAFMLLTINQLTGNPGSTTGVADLAGNLLDGGGTGVPGNPFASVFALGSSLSYVDRDGDHVSLQLTGGGVMELFRTIDGEARLLRLDGTVAGQSTLSGQVKRSPTSDGLTSLRSMIGLGRVRNTLTTPPFVIG